MASAESVAAFDPARVRRLPMFSDCSEEEFARADTLQKHGEFEEVGTIVDAGVYEDLGQEII